MKLANVLRRLWQAAWTPGCINTIDETTIAFQGANAPTLYVTFEHLK